MSKDIPETSAATEAKKEKPAAPRKTETAPAVQTGDMTAEQAANLIVAPYVTEKTFTQIEKENKLAFIVAEKASKNEIMEAIRILYETETTEVNTARTIRGKKAFVRFKSPEGARELATKLGLV
jgi:large subunit ribosomal protein L23